MCFSRAWLHLYLKLVALGTARWRTMDKWAQNLGSDPPHISETLGKPLNQLCAVTASLCLSFPTL